MFGPNDLAKEIEEFRAELMNLIEGKDELRDPEVLQASRRLDLLLNRFCALPEGHSSKK